MPEKPRKQAVLPVVSVEWTMIKAALFWLGGGLLLAVALWVGSREYLRYLLQWDNQQHQTSSRLQKELASVKEALAIVNTDYYSDFQKFTKNGFFQVTQLPVEEQRLAAIEQIKGIILKLKIPTVSYTLSERAPYEASAEFSLPTQLKIYNTQLKLELGLLHEGDLLNLVEHLKTQSPLGIFNWQRCELQRKSELNFKDATQTNILANCTLQWYTATTIEP